MRVASIDIGTNTALCLIADVESQQLQKIVWEGLKTVRLGEGVDRNKYFKREALQRLDESLGYFRTKMFEHHVEKVVVVATSASRDVSNRAEFEKVLGYHGLTATVISGDDEALLTFRGAFQTLPGSLAAVIDVGGGSTEVTIGNNQSLVWKKSFDVGSVRLTERWVKAHPISNEELKQLTEAIAKEFQELRDVVSMRMPDAELETLVAVAGTPTNLASIILGKPFDPDAVEGFKLSVDQMTEWAERLSKMSVAERCQVSGLDAGRADVIVAGILILKAATEALNRKDLIVSTRGLRYGALLESRLWRAFS